MPGADAQFMNSVNGHGPPTLGSAFFARQKQGAERSAQRSQSWLCGSARKYALLRSRARASSFELRSGGTSVAEVEPSRPCSPRWSCLFCLPGVFDVFYLYSGLWDARMRPESTPERNQFGSSSTLGHSGVSPVWPCGPKSEPTVGRGSPGSDWPRSREARPARCARARCAPRCVVDQARRPPRFGCGKRAISNQR